LTLWLARSPRDTGISRTSVPDALRIEILRSGLVESVISAAFAATDMGGNLIATAGDTTRTFFYRSTAKPFQAAVVQELGARLVPEQLAVACSSHDGDPVHVAYVESILDGVGLTEHALQCPTSWPLNPRSMRELGTSERLRRLWHNCSGKHASMLRACQAQGWDLDTYLSPEHPLQSRITALIDEMSGGVEPVGVDGCGVPVHRVDTERLARAYSKLNDARFAEVTTAMHRYPQLVSGSGNVDAVVATWLNAVVKRGAEGCLAGLVYGHGAFALRILDGTGRVLGPAVFTLLDRLGWIPHGARGAVEQLLDVPIRGAEMPVGRVRVDLELRWI